MKKWMTAMLAALMLFALCGIGLAADEGSIVQSSCNIVKSGDYYLVYCYAQVHNNSDQIICLDHGTFQLSNGEQLLYSSEVSQLWPYFIAPGQDGYLFDIASFEPNEDGVVVPNVTGIHFNNTYMTIDQAYAGQDLIVQAQIENGMGENDCDIICRITNPTQTDAYNATLAFGLYTDSGVLLYADGRTLDDVGIPAGGTVLARFELDELFVEQWKSSGASPTVVNATAMFRGNED